MYCGSCMHNNTMARALIRQGHDVALVPTYTPIRTDEDSVAIDRVFFGAVNVYLKQYVGLFRHAPRLVEWMLDRPRLLSWVSRFAGSTDAKVLGEMTLAILEGEHGPQKGELEKLVSWLRDDMKPDVVHLSLSLFLGFAHRIKDELGVPVVCELQGEDIFFDLIEEPYRSQVLALLHRRADDVDAFIAPNRYYAELMSSECGFPAQRIHVVPLGIEPGDFLDSRERTESGPAIVGFLGRICPEKGFHLLVEAFRILVEELGPGRVKLRAAGYLRELDRPFYEVQLQRLADWGLLDRFEYAGEVDRQGKVDFLAGLHVFTLPTVYREPKGLSVLEAMASGVPVVLPSHGGFPELVAASGGGILVEPESPIALAAGLRRLIADPARRRALGVRGRRAVEEELSADSMARSTADVYERVLRGDATVGDVSTERAIAAAG